MEAASLLITHSMSTIFDKQKAVTVKNTMESPYTIRKNTVCRILRSDSQAIQVYQISAHGNLLCNSGRKPKSDHSPD